MEPWEEILESEFNDVAVDKRRILELDPSRNNLPSYVWEYVVSVFTEPSGTINFHKLESYLKRHRPEKRKANMVKNELKRYGSYKLLDSFSVKVDLHKNDHKLHIPLLDVNNGSIENPSLVEDHPRMLLDGVWGLGDLTYDLTTKRIGLESFEAIQLSDVDLDAYKQARENFTFDGWIKALISTLGYNPEEYQGEQAWHLIARLIPLVQPNVNLIELAPKGTGKTYMLRNVSSFSRVISGGTVSPATLFYNLNTNTPGLLAEYDCVIFDEIQNTKFGNPEEVVGKLKDYMESGNYDRGRHQVQSEASVILLGNLPIGKNGKPADVLYFSVLPEHLQETAFLDRFHGFLPGWELPRLKDSATHFSQGLGLAADYFSEILHALRNQSPDGILEERIALEQADIRDEKSIKRLAGGLIKLLYPNNKVDKEGLRQIVDIAVSYRQRIADQLHRMDREYKMKTIDYSIK